MTLQLKRLERMHQDTSEATITRTHIDVVLSLPWNIHSKDNLDLKHVNKTLDEDHHGLQQVKDRIIEYLAVKKLNPNAKSPIICFVGPPGVGKTSLGRSIAKAMGREFSRISLGGVRDEADIRGHRKTYVGAFPGRVIQSIKQAETANPIIMLDEIDKLGSDHRGDPASALLEVLDPEQNSKFVDHYLGVEFDLSGVMFVANANNLETIPHALRDRLEIINVSGYSEEEKHSISNQFLIPKQVKETGLSNAGIQFTKSAVQAVIRGYTRESGLRNLEKQFASIFRKIARQIAEEDESGKKKSVQKITPSVVEKHLGVKKFDDAFYHMEPAVGVSLGLAYTQFGGEILAIETNLIPGKSNLVLTGQLGDVMKESAQAAWSFIRSRSAQFGIDLNVLKDNEVHLHVPAGAVPKDGPSAGIAIATSIISALLNIAPREKSCMTGEITLHGKVLPIGGLKEKVLAAQREGAKNVLIPYGNKSAYIALPHHVKRGISVKFVKTYDEVFDELFAQKGHGLTGRDSHLHEVNGTESSVAS
ncbi:MAG: endopeptidase La [Bdellovibrionota bacterium]